MGVTFIDTNYYLKLYDQVKDDFKFVYSSGIRVKIIISLTRGTSRLKDLKEDLNVDSSTILHAMKKLENRDLIYKKRDEYFISQTGKVVGLKLIDMIKMLFTFKENEDLIFDSELPVDMLMEFKDLEFSDFTITDDLDFAHHFRDDIMGSNMIRALTPISTVSVVGTCRMIVEKGKEMEVIIKPPLFEEITDILDPKLLEKMIDLISQDKMRIWTAGQDMDISFFLTDRFIFLGFLKTNGNEVNLKDMISYNPKAIDWGNKLFDYYLGNSKRL